VFVEVLQAGVEPEQLASELHATQVLVEVLQAGVEPEQFESDKHPTQVLVAVSHVGVEPEQLAFERHDTHVFVVVLHTFPVVQSAVVLHVPAGSDERDLKNRMITTTTMMTTITAMMIPTMRPVRLFLGGGC